MTLREFNTRFKNNSDKLANNIMTVIGTKLAHDLVAMINYRVEQKGVNAFGRTFSPYISESYKSYRERKGKQTTFKDFSFTRAMWLGFNMKSLTVNQGVITFTLGGTNQDSENKIGWNSKQEGMSIIQASKEEKAFLVNNVLKTIKETLTIK